MIHVQAGTGPFVATVKILVPFDQEVVYMCVRRVCVLQQRQGKAKSVCYLCVTHQRFAS